MPVSLALGLDISQAPEFIQQFPASLQTMIVSAFAAVGISNVPEFIVAIPRLVTDLLGSSLATGGLYAILLNLLIPETEKSGSAG